MKRILLHNENDETRPKKSRCGYSIIKVGGYFPDNTISKILTKDVEILTEFVGKEVVYYTVKFVDNSIFRNVIDEDLFRKYDEYGLNTMRALNFEICVNCLIQTPIKKNRNNTLRSMQIEIDEGGFTNYYA